jgi:hypothetical protein
VMLHSSSNSFSSSDGSSSDGSSSSSTCVDTSGQALGLGHGAALLSVGVYCSCSGWPLPGCCTGAGWQGLFDPLFKCRCLADALLNKQTLWDRGWGLL